MKNLQLVPFEGKISEEEIQAIVSRLREARGALIFYEFPSGDTGYHDVGESDPRLLHFEAHLFFHKFMETLHIVKMGEL